MQPSLVPAARTLLVSIVVLGLAGCAALRGGGELVASVTKAPIDADGNVAGRPADFVINLSGDMAPESPGRALAKGGWVKIEFPPEFKRTNVPLVPRFAPGKCPASCAAAILLQGWPQQPIPLNQYEARFEGSHTLVIAATEDIRANPPSDPGIKQIHLMATAFSNPPAGDDRIRVSAQTGPGGAIESGSGTLTIHSSVRPSINVTSVFATPKPPRPNLIYQSTSVGMDAPFAFDFLLWDADGLPLNNVVIAPADRSRFPRYTGGLLKQGERVVGGIIGSAPVGATGQRAWTDAPSREVQAPITGIPVSHLRVRFQAGSKPGNYAPTFELLNGNAQQMIVRVR